MSKSNFLSAAVLCVLFSNSAWADSPRGAFDGPYVSLGAGYEMNRIHSENVSTTSFGGLSFDQPTVSQTHGAGQILAGYGFSFTPDLHINPEYTFSPKLSLAANIFHNFGNDEVGDITATFYGDRTQEKLSNSFGVSLEPGYYINDRTLAYVKLGYARADMEYNRENYAVALNNSIGGYLLGGGAKYLITDGIYVGADWTYYAYKHGRQPASLGAIPVSVYSKAEQTVGLITVGYQF